MMGKRAAKKRPEIDTRFVGSLVSYLRATQPSFWESAPMNEEGRRVFVPFLMEDTVHDVLERVCKMGGDALGVTLIDDDDQLRFKSARLTVTDSLATGKQDCDIPVPSSTTMADMYRVMLPGVSMTLRLVNDELIFESLPSQDIGEDATRHAKHLAGTS